MEKQKIILEKAHTQFEIWNNALQTRDPKEVEKIYRDDATLMPTFPQKGKEVVGKDGILEYFQHFLLKLPYGRIVWEEVKQISVDVFRHNGLYDFEIGEEGNRTIVHAKFIFEWKEEGGDTKILFHGSFPIPE